jgi:mRNA-degrading endonuclease HigB of HigAB toxin-antitoxin module
MATKKAAKKAEPKVEEVEQIVLTQDQWDELSEIRFTLNSLMWELENAVDKDSNVGQVAFEIGRIYVRLSDTHSKLDKLVDATDPEEVYF